MSTYEPEPHLTELGVQIVCEPFPSPRKALYLPRYNAVWVQPGQHPIQVRCELAHEVVHVEDGGKHTNGSKERHRIIENRCDRVAAQRLITFDDLIGQAEDSDDLGQWAMNLRVNGRMIRSRLRSLTPGERELLESIHLDR